MPKGPQGQKRPGDLIGAAIIAAKIATGEIEETPPKGKKHTSKGGKKGGKARAKALTPAERSEIASLAAAVNADPEVQRLPAEKCSAR